MLYYYTASDKKDNIVESEIEAEGLPQVLQYLASKELRPISIKPLKERTLASRILGGRIKLSDKVFLAKYLALMLKVGTDLLSAINILIADSDKPAMRNFLLEIRDSLSRGRPFYEAFEKHPETFSLVFVNLVKAAESSGNLEKTFEKLSVSLQKEADLKNRIKSALVYPVVLVFASVAVISFLIAFALPKIAKVFEESGIEPPLFSKVVFSIGLFLGKNIIVILVLFFLLVAVIVYFGLFSIRGKRIIQKFLSRLPIIGGIFRDIAIERFASTYSSLTKAGMPIIDTINISAQVVGLEEFSYALRRIAEEGLAKGLTVGEAFKGEAVFPKVLTNLIAISEKAGHIEEVLGTLSDFYSSSIDARIRSLVTFLEPALLIVFGIIVAVIALSIVIPVYQLTTQF